MLQGAKDFTCDCAGLEESRPQSMSQGSKDFA
jgi:hypothetical protein